MREYIQNKLKELDDVISSPPIEEDVIEEGKTYFGYQITDNLIDMDVTHRLTIRGFLTRKDSDDNSLGIIDKATKDIVNKLKEINIHCSCQDISLNGVIKVQITGQTTYNDLNKGLI